MTSPVTPREPIAHARHVSKIYGTGDRAVAALNDVTLDFYAGEFTAIMGPSGSGKSTLMHCLAGLDAPTDGLVVVKGVDIGNLGERQLTRFRRDHVGFIFQAFNLLPALTAEQNMMLPLQLAGKSADPYWFDLLVTSLGLQSRLHHKPSELSGGQQQRVACARALLAKPSIIFADEPTGNLDSSSSHQVLQFLQQAVHQHGQTVVMVTHEATAAEYADRVVFVQDGQLRSELREPTGDAVLQHMALLRDTSQVVH